MVSLQRADNDIKVVILAGGLGTRLAEETEARLKPIVELGGRPILWHIMKHYAHYGFKVRPVRVIQSEPLLIVRKYGGNSLWQQ